MALTCNSTITTLAIALSAAAAFGQGTIHPIATLNGGSFVFPSGISDDGTTVVGDAGVSGGSYRAFRWTTSTGTQSLGTAAGHVYSSGYNISGDGTTVVGVSGATYDIASRWTAGTGMVTLGALTPGQPSFAFATSANGSVIVGDGYYANGTQRAWKWTASTGMTALSATAPGTTHSLALTVNASGTHIAGYCYNNAPALVWPEGVLWLPDGSLLAMGHLPNTVMTVPSSLTADGMTAFGYCANADSSIILPFRWSASSNTMTAMPLPAGYDRGVAGSNSGTAVLVAGYATDANGSSVGCVWEANGTVSTVAAFLANRGFDVSGWTFTGAVVNSTGTALAGTGSRLGVSTAWHVNLGLGCTAAPQITTNPQPLAVTDGSAATFFIEASGTSVGFQWNKDDAPIPGALGQTLTLSSVTLADAGIYSCTVHNNCGPTTSNGAMLTVTTLCPPPTIYEHPTDLVSCAGTSTAIAVNTDDAGDQTYQWTQNGNDVPGARGRAAILTFDALTPDDAGTYVCIIENDCEHVESNPAVVTVAVSCCDSLDFNNDGNIDPSDVDAYFSILGEGPCLGDIGNGCSDLDFNNDSNIDPTDVDAYFSILGEGPCM